jgi:hypothetical protein
MQKHRRPNHDPYENVHTWHCILVFHASHQKTLVFDEIHRRRITRCGPQFPLIKTSGNLFFTRDVHNKKFLFKIGGYEKWRNIYYAISKF